MLDGEKIVFRLYTSRSEDESSLVPCIAGSRKAAVQTKDE